MEPPPTIRLGSRVVVRSRTGGTGPSGGPEMTDVIGHVRSIDSVAIEVEHRDGALVRMLWRDVIACKPVPERPERPERE